MLLFPYPVVVPASNDVRIQWLHTYSGSATLSWGTNSNHMETAAVSWTGGVLFSRTISNLASGKRYRFTVESDSISSEGSFLVPDDSAAEVSFFLIGDTRTGTAVLNGLCGRMNAVRATNSALDSFLIHVGDLVTDGESAVSWENEFFNPAFPELKKILENVPVIAASGNHEGNRVLFNTYFPYGFSDSYGRFRHGPAAFFILNQYSPYSPGSAQFTWLTNSLAQETAPWKVLVLHDGGWNAGSHENNTDVQSWLQPVCTANNVRLVLCGHNHNYAHALVNGVHHLTSGGGGGPLHEVDTNRPFIIAARKSWQFAILRADSSLFSVEVLSDSGERIEYFNITN